MILLLLKRWLCSPIDFSIWLGRTRSSWAEVVVTKAQEKKQKGCFNCKKPGHFITDCRDLQKEKSKEKSKKPTIKSNNFRRQIKQSLMATWEDLNNESGFDKDETVASEAEPETDSEDENEICLRGKESQKSWYLDSGCSRHMTGEMSMFLTLIMKEGGPMGFGGNQNGKIIGIGTIGNSFISIKNVWVVDGLRHKLLNIS